MTELKPCPFCGGKAQRIKRGLDERYAYANQVTYRCTGCGVEKSAIGIIPGGGYADNSTVEARALDAWNRRAEPEKVEPVAWTEEMADAGFDALEARGFRVTASDLGKEDLRAVFEAIRAAAPQQEQK